MKVCKKELFKSTYRGFAFKKGKEYQVTSEDDKFIFIKDEKGHNFNFVKEAAPGSIFYYLDDYFA